MHKHFNALILLAAAWFTTGCSPTIHAGTSTADSPPPIPYAAPVPAPQVSIGFVTNHASSYWREARQGAMDAQSTNPDVHVDFVMCDTYTVSAQTAYLSRLLGQGDQAIAICPVDPKAETAVLNDAASKVDLITLDSDAPNTNRLCYIGTDNHAAGMQAARLIRSALPGGGAIMLFVGNIRAQNAVDRVRGLRCGLAGSNIHIAGVLTDDTDADTATANARNVLETQPDVRALVGLWGYDGPALARAVVQVHQVGKIKIVCWDANPETLAGIRKGEIFGSIVQQPYKFAALSVKYLARAVKGDKSWIPAGKCIYVPVRTLTKANLSQFMAGH